MKRAVVDMGTNSFRLLVAEMQGGEIARGRKYVRMVRLGEALDQSGRIGSDAIKRCMEILGEYAAIAEAEGIRELEALATSAVRDAANSDEIVGLIESGMPIKVEILSGEREAEVGFAGVVSSFEDEGDFLMVDVGGGSTEFVYGNKREIKFKKSLDMGAVRMTERFVWSDPVDDEDAERLSKHIDGMLEDNLSGLKRFAMGEMVGIGGTITTMGAVKLKMEKYDRERIHMTRLTKREVGAMTGEFRRLSLSDRKMIKGLEAGRADIIYAGSVILQRIMAFYGSESIVISENDNLEGYLLTKKL